MENHQGEPIPPEQEAAAIDPALQAIMKIIGTMHIAAAKQTILEAADQGKPDAPNVRPEASGEQLAAGEYAHSSLRSGMQIPASPVRVLLQEKLTAAHTIERANDAVKDPDQYALANVAADSVGEVAGITVLEPGDYSVRYYRCAQYAFGTVDGRGWARSHDVDITMDFWENTTDFLVSDGYELVETPQEGDIIVYANEPGPTVTEAVHVSVLGRNGRATAKFNQGPIVEHPIGLVPQYYGSYLYFFRWRQAD